MAKRGGKAQTKGPKTLEVSIPPAPPPYEVNLTQQAEQVYVGLMAASDAAIARGDNGNQHCTTFRMVDDAIRRLIPADPRNPKYALHKPLNDLYRLAKGRTRIAWVVHPSSRKLLIVFISDEPRKEGDKGDPYAVLTHLHKAGYLTKIIEDWQAAMYVPPDARVN